MTGGAVVSEGHTEASERHSDSSTTQAYSPADACKGSRWRQPVPSNKTHLSIWTLWYLCRVMKVLDSITVSRGDESSVIELCCGDLTLMETGDEVDILVISAFPDDYTPSPTSLIGALSNKGVSVAYLAATKAVDLRPYCCCWLSADIKTPPSGINYRRILCFEPLVRGEPHQMVEDLFRGITPFLSDAQPSYSIAMPLLAGGDQAVPIVAIMGTLLRAALRWIRFGLPIRRLRIVERSPLKAAWMRDEFALVKKSIGIGTNPDSKRPRWPIRHLLSYAPEDHLLRDELVQSLQVLRRQKTIEIWHEGLVLPGADVDGELRQHLEHDDVVLLLVSPDYLASDRCMDQAEIAMKRHERHEVRLIPVLVRPAAWSATPFGSLPPLPTEGTAVTNWLNRDQAWSNISGGIRLLSM